MSGATTRITARRLPARGTSTIDGTAQQIASTVRERPMLFEEQPPAAKK